MPHIHAVPGPRRSPVATLILAIVLLLILAALAWYFLAGPGRSQIHTPKLGMVVWPLAGALHVDLPRAIQQMNL